MPLFTSSLCSPEKCLAQRSYASASQACTAVECPLPHQGQCQRSAETQPLQTAITIGKAPCCTEFAKMTSFLKPKGLCRTELVKAGRQPA